MCSLFGLIDYGDVLDSASDNKRLFLSFPENARCAKRMQPGQICVQQSPACIQTAFGCLPASLSYSQRK